MDGHDAHILPLVTPAPDENVPALHLVHWELIVTFANVPARHVRQVDPPSRLENLPRPHASQATELLMIVLYIPVVHSVHWDTPDAEYEPGKQE